jgi:hypothetical protein
MRLALHVVPHACALVHVLSSLPGKLTREAGISGDVVLDDNDGYLLVTMNHRDGDDDDDDDDDRKKIGKRTKDAGVATETTCTVVMQWELH